MMRILMSIALSLRKNLHIPRGRQGIAGHDLTFAPTKISVIYPIVFKAPRSSFGVNLVIRTPSSASSADGLPPRPSQAYNQAFTGQILIPSLDTVRMFREAFSLRVATYHAKENSFHTLLHWLNAKITKHLWRCHQLKIKLAANISTGISSLRAKNFNLACLGDYV